MRTYPFGKWQSHPDGTRMLSIDIGDGETISFLRREHGGEVVFTDEAKTYFNGDMGEMERVKKLAPACPE